MISNKTLCTLQFAYGNKTPEENFETLANLIRQTPKDAIVLAPELCLSGYAYENMSLVAEFSTNALPSILELSQGRTIAFTLIERVKDGYINSFKIFHDGAIIQSRPKAKLFSLGMENDFFIEGKSSDIQIVNIDGIKIASLVCFELRFIELWQQIKGADIILVPAYWGLPRKEQLQILSTALAVANQAFVVVSNSQDALMASSSAIISPFGKVFSDDSKNIIEYNADLKEVEKMRKYITLG
ncbi:MAG: carbon-nitrogen hydrolase family protein [Sulfurospirillaceae bacterium]|nr:carbon-nitrogen hydrolase family protein [Sulfurospirillaceae bacterium]